MPLNGERRAWFANLFGLADILIVASSLALVLLPEIGPHHPMMYAVFLPAPLWLWFHIISIAKLVSPDAAAFRPTRKGLRIEGQQPGLQPVDGSTRNGAPRCPTFT